jgi:hypothetical protein
MKTKPVFVFQWGVIIMEVIMVLLWEFNLLFSVHFDVPSCRAFLHVVIDLACRMPDPALVNTDYHGRYLVRLPLQCKIYPGNIRSYI